MSLECRAPPEISRPFNSHDLSGHSSPLKSRAPRVSRSHASLAAPQERSGPARLTHRAHVPLAVRASVGAHGSRAAAELRPRPPTHFSRA